MDTGLVLGEKYVPRFVDLGLKEALDSAGAVILEGARATGKTMTALNAANSFMFLDSPEATQLMDVAPSAILVGENPRLLDEWQLAPELWNMVRRAVDKNHSLGQFILTGSAVPTDDVTRHTGAGRFLRIRQRTMTWTEKLASPETSLSLADLFGGLHPDPVLETQQDIDAVINNILLSGFPALRSLPINRGMARLRGYIDDIAHADLARLAEIRHSPEVIKQLIAALSRNVATEVTFATLADDVRAIAPNISTATISQYVELLERLFFVELQHPWAPVLRSKARLRTAPKLHIVDPAVAAAALRATSAGLLQNTSTLGQLFESAVIHDLTVFAGTMGGEVRHYRDSNNNEIDAVITLPDGRWAAVEVKLGGHRFAQGVKSLEKAVAQIDEQSSGAPAFKLVVTGTGPILTTNSGSITAPLSALEP